MGIDDFLGMDFEWYAVDSVGHIGFFTSGGSSCFPSVFLDSPNDRNLAWQAFNGLSATKSATVIRRNGRIEDWILASEKGFYGYDYDLHRDTGYLLVTVPSDPLVIAIDSINFRLPFFSGLFGSDILTSNDVISWRMHQIIRPTR